MSKQQVQATTCIGVSGDPYFDYGLRRWLEKTAAANVYRVGGFDLDDLVQEGLLCYHKVRERYVGKLMRGKDGHFHRYLPLKHPNRDNIAHFVSLVKVSFLNRISTLARRFPPVETPVSALCGPEEDAGTKLDQLAQHVSEGIDETGLVLDKLPAEIRSLIDLLISDGLELTGRRRLGSTPGARRRLTTDEKLSRLMGLKTPRPIRSEVAEYFGVAW